MTLTTSTKLLDKFGSIRVSGQPEPADEAGRTYRVPMETIVKSIDFKSVVEQVVIKMPDIITGPMLDNATSETYIIVDTAYFVGEANSMNELSVETLSNIRRFVQRVMVQFINSVSEVAEEVLKNNPSNEFASTTSSSKAVSRRQSRPRSGPMASRR